MKSIVLTGIKKFEIQDIPKPSIQSDHDVLLKIAVVGICGSDLHYYAEGRIGDQIINYPFTIGHECSAIVEAVGQAVKRVKPGDRISVDPTISCGQCDQCIAGRTHTCRNQKFLGCPGQMSGCLSEYIIMPEKCCFKVGENISLTQAALIEPLSIGAYAVSLLKNKKPKAVGILGVGPIGLSVLLACKKAGIETIFVTDKIDHRLRVARRVGASWIGKPDQLNKSDEIEVKSLDAVFECCGQHDALNQAVSVLKPGGELLVVGIPESDQVSFNIHLLRRKEIDIQNVRRQNGFVQPVIEWVQQGLVEIDFMATHHYNFEQVQDAFETVKDYRDGVIKAVVYPGGVEA
jgi:L-iditol 2-dehydrogenase